MTPFVAQQTVPSQIISSPSHTPVRGKDTGKYAEYSSFTHAVGPGFRMFLFVSVSSGIVVFCLNCGSRWFISDS